MVVWVREKEMESFLPLVPFEMKDSVMNGSLICLGAYSEEDGKRNAVGVLVFYPDSDIIVDEERASMIELRWIYVIPDQRGKGYANDMMEALSEILEDNPADGIVCDVPMGSEYDLAEAFFVSWGFTFEVTSGDEMIITKNDYRKQLELFDEDKHAYFREMLEKSKNTVVSIMDIPEEDFIKTIREVKRVEKDAFYQYLSEDREMYAGDMSYVSMDNGAITSIILFERSLSNELNLVALTSFFRTSGKQLAYLINYASQYYYYHYPENATIRLPRRKEQSKQLTDRMFPQKETAIIRRGFFY